MPQKPRKNPFFTLLMIVSTLFLVTTLGYLVGPFVEQRAIASKGTGANPVSVALAGWFERRGVVALAIEFVVMTVLAILSMTTDRYFSQPITRAIPPAAPGGPTG